jgi:hypothetical protein
MPIEESVSAKLVELVENTWLRRNEISESIREHLPELRVQAERNVDSVVELLGMDKVSKNVAKR